MEGATRKHWVKPDYLPRLLITTITAIITTATATIIPINNTQLNGLVGSVGVVEGEAGGEVVTAVVGLGEEDADGDGDAVDVGETVTDGEGDGETVGVGEGEGDGDGVGVITVNRVK